MKKNTFKLLTIFIIGVALFSASCTKDKIEEPIVTPPDNKIIWSGANITFEKADGAEPGIANNQDRINDDVWITREIGGGEIYNAKAESAHEKNVSPKGTAWAVGKISDVDNLEFKSFRSAVGKPKEVIGKDLVLFLTDKNIFISVKFTKWSEGNSNKGGFAYTRSTE